MTTTGLNFEMFQRLDIGIVVHAPDSSILFSNNRASELLGLSTEQLSGKDAIDPAWHFVDEDGRAMSPDQFPISRILATQKPLKNFVLGIRWTTQAQPIWVLVNGFPEFEASGALHHVVVNFFDITDRKKAEFLVRKNDAMSRAVLDSLSAHIAVVDAQGIIVRVNDAWRRFGSNNGGQPSTQSPIGVNYFDVCGPREGDADPTAVQTAQGLRSVLSGEVSGFELEYPCDSPEERRWFQLKITPMQAEFGGAVVSHENITARKASEAASQQSEAFVRTVIDTVPGMLAYWSVGLKCQFSNGAYEAWFGRTAEDIRGISMQTLLGDTLFPLNETYVRGALGGQSQQFERVLTKANGEVAHTWTQYIPHWQDGQVTGFLASVTDISELKKVSEALSTSNQELARSNADLEQFAFAASHDLQEPLRSVTSCVQLLKKRYEGHIDARADEFIAHAVSGTTRMQQLIDDLLLYSRLSAGGQKKETEPLSTALKLALSNLSSAIEQSQADITFDDLPVVSAYKGQMAQLFQNLVANALKFRGDKKPIIHIGAKKAALDWVISVQDNGIGIEPQHYDRVFKLFQRLHTRNEIAGTGIGLTLCQKIVERHGGRIWLESEPKQGTTFFFSLPDAAPNGT